jgi:hypothetical protein
MGLSGLQFIMSSGGAGTLWHIRNGEATPRPASSIVSPTTTTTTLPAPAQFSFAQTPGGEYLVALAGNGNAFLYDSLADAFTTARQVLQNPIQSYYGPAAGASNGNFFMVNGLILSSALAQIGGAERPGVVQFGPPPQPGQPPTQTIVSAGQRHIAAVAPVDENRFVRMTIPVRQNLNAVTRDDPRAVMEMVDTRTMGETVVAIAPDTPQFLVFGAQRIGLPARQIAVDSKGTAYVVGLTGLSVVPLSLGGAPVMPEIPTGTRGVVNANDGSTRFFPGSFVTISGRNLAKPGVSDQLPLPTVMGGSCVTLSDTPLSLLTTSSEQITAQIPDNLRPGLYVTQVRSLDNATKSTPVVITVQRP